MKRHWSDDELLAHWTLTPPERDWVDTHRTAHTRLGCALLLKTLLYVGRFPRGRHELPTVVIQYMAHQLDVLPSAFREYAWTGRSIKGHRAAIRRVTGIRKLSRAEIVDLTRWAASRLMEQPHPTVWDGFQDQVVAHCRTLRREPPVPTRMTQLLRAAGVQAERTICAHVCQRLTPAMRAALDALLQVAGEPDVPTDTPLSSPIAQLKRDTGALSVETVTTACAHLATLQAIGLPPTLFHGLAPRLLQQLRQRVLAEELHELRRHPDDLRTTLVAAFCLARTQELTDAVVDLLLALIHRIGAKAERTVERRVLKDLKRVMGKTRLLYRVAAAALTNPDGSVRAVVYPVMSEQTSRDLVAEAAATGDAYEERVQLVMRNSYRNHYRRAIPLILRALQLRTSTASDIPVLRAMQLIIRYGATGTTQPYFSLRDQVPLAGVVRPMWESFVIEPDDQGRPRINRINYELAALQVLREKLRCKEVWVEGAARFRNPDADLPSDFAEQRDAYCTALNQPTAATMFIAGLQQELKQALTRFNATIRTNPHVRLTTKDGRSRIHLDRLTVQPEPRNLGALKAEILRRWPLTSLLDMLKEVDFRTQFSAHFTSATGRSHLDPAILQQRLLLCLYGLGTNAGLKRMGAGNTSDAYRELLYVKQRYLTTAHLRAAIAQVANAIFAQRLPEIWGEATTTCAADSKKFGAWDQNLLTEWHMRYRGPGIMVYWHVERKSTCIYSQVKSCSSSEVAAMLDGVLRHGTEMQIEKQFVDSHGQSEVAFAFCHLLGFQLLPRLKGIARQKLYRPDVGAPDAYPHLQPILTRPINWGLIQTHYDEVIKFATALRIGTTDAESLLRRFLQTSVEHPAYSAIKELGKVIKTLFLCEYLTSEGLRPVKCVNAHRVACRPYKPESSGKTGVSSGLGHSFASESALK